MILFEKLRWKNLLSTGNIFTELDLNKVNTTLIVGENGAGKSTILDALSFSLFGKPFRKINKPQLVNTITRKDMVVEIEFSISSNRYKIVRGLKPNIFEVYQNGNLLNQSAEMKDYQNILEKQILKINHKSFCQVVVVGTATFQPFMQLSASARREIIEDLLDLQIFTTMNTLLKSKVADNNEFIIEATAEQKYIIEKIELVKKHMLELQNNNDHIISEKQELIVESNKQIETLSAQYWELDAQIKEMKETIKDEKEISKRMNKFSSIRHQIEAKVAILNNELIHLFVMLLLLRNRVKFLKLKMVLFCFRNNMIRSMLS